ncbi:hypothetical protein J6590_000694 [Homalodisca vitripennis]|nr:hypothetical protein J6590_000694 [Homalodisca vitripennis]
MGVNSWAATHGITDRGRYPVTPRLPVVAPVCIGHMSLVSTGRHCSQVFLGVPRKFVNQRKEEVTRSTFKGETKLGQLSGEYSSSQLQLD